MNGNLHDLEIALNQNNDEIKNWYVDDCGRSALHVAALHDHHHLLEQLLDAGLNINEKDNNDDTALHIASRYGNIEFAERLLELGAHIDDSNIDKYEICEDHIDSKQLVLSDVDNNDIDQDNDIDCKDLILAALDDRDQTVISIKAGKATAYVKKRRQGIDIEQGTRIAQRRGSYQEV